MSEKSDRTQLNIFVSGRVQGVFFRRGARAEAERLRISGVAANRPDGTVEIVAQGSRVALESFLDWCYPASLLPKVGHLSFRWRESTH